MVSVVFGRCAFRLLAAFADFCKTMLRK
jgi:hypothetical protein